MSNDSAIRDMMDSIASGKASEVQTKFDSLMMDKAQQALSKMNIEGSEQYLYSSKLSYLDSLKEMKDALIFSGAPTNIISYFDMLIKEVKRILSSVKDPA